MSDKEKSGKKESLTLSSPNKLSLTKTVESGKVKQNFQRGRSKTVTVEVKKTRTFTRSKSGMVEVDKGASEASKQRMLNQAEREARLKALQSADKNDDALSYQVVKPQRSDMGSNDADTQEQNDATSSDAANTVSAPVDDLAARNLEALRNAPSNKQQVQAQPSAAPAIKRGASRTEVDDKKSKSPKKSLKA
jgi:translation initiation factor IF-2